MDRTMIECPKTLPKMKIDRSAPTALEYAMMAGLLALVVLAASSILGGGIESAFRGLARVL
jgi:Flp pilus assembly pilin Flp